MDAATKRLAELNNTAKQRWQDLSPVVRQVVDPLELLTTDEHAERVRILKEQRQIRLIK